MILFYQFFRTVHELVLEDCVAAVLYTFEYLNITRRKFNLLIKDVSEVLDVAVTVVGLRVIVMRYIHSLFVEASWLSAHID